MPFHTDGPKERILLMGGPGSGKTRAYLSIAELLQKSGSDATVYVIDTDYAVDYMLQIGFSDLENVVFSEVADWPEYMQAVNDFQKVIQPGDWLVGDLLNYAWEAVQEHYSTEAYGKDMADHFMERRQRAAKMKKSKQSDDGWEGSSDWQIIKPLYRAFVNRFMYRHRAHVLATCGVKPIARDGKWKDNNEVVATFGHIGFKPEGEKRTPHHPHSIIHLRRSNTGEFMMTTAKDRERPDMVDVSLGTEESPGSFAKSYLIGVAKWSLR